AARHAAAVAAGSTQADHPGVLRLDRDYLDVLLSSTAADAPTATVRDLLEALLDSKAVSHALVAHRQRTLLEADAGEARADFERLQALRRRLADALLHGPGARPPSDHRRECDDLRRRAEELEAGLARRVKALGDWRRAYRAPVEEVAKRLAGGEVL